MVAPGAEQTDHLCSLELHFFNGLEECEMDILNVLVKLTASICLSTIKSDGKAYKSDKFVEELFTQGGLDM